MKILGVLLAFLLLTHLAWASQRTQVKEGNELFKRQQWDAAIDRYLNALESKDHADIVHYDLGAAFYKQGNYDQAIEHLKKSFSDKNKRLSSMAQYNLGNAFYQKALSMEDKNLDDAISFLQQSLNSYEKALNSNSKDKDAQYNRQVVERELERLRKKKEQQNKEKKQDAENKQDGQDKQDSKNTQPQESPNQPSSSQQEQVKNFEDNQKDKNQEDQDQKQSKQDEQKGAQNNQVQQNSSQETGAQSAQDQNENMQAQKESMLKKQAKEMLDEYEREDAPKGLLNFIQHRKGESHVDKDW